MINSKTALSQTVANTPNLRSRVTRNQTLKTNLSEIRQNITVLSRLSPVVTRASLAKSKDANLNSQKAASSYQYTRTRSFNENLNNSS